MIIKGREIDRVFQQVMQGELEGAGQNLPVEADRDQRILLQIDGLVAGHPSSLGD